MSGQGKLSKVTGLLLFTALAAMTGLIIYLIVLAMWPQRQVDRMVVPVTPQGAN